MEKQAVVKKEKKAKPKISYVLEDWDSGNAIVYKMEDGKNTTTYRIKNGRCSCPGFEFNLYCKHLGFLVGDPPSNELPAATAQAVADRYIQDLLPDSRKLLLLGDVRVGREPCRRVHLCMVPRNPDAFDRKKRRIIGWSIEGIAIIIDMEGS